MRQRVLLFDSVDATTAQTSNAVDIGDYRGVSVQVGFKPEATASVFGTLKLQGSNEPELLGWVDIPDSDQEVVAAAGHLWNISDMEYRYLRVVWTPATVTGKSWALTPDVDDAAYTRENTAEGVTYTSDQTGATGDAYTATGTGPYLVTVASVAHGLVTGETITVSNGSDSDVDGSQTITVVDADTFTFSNVADPSASGTLDWVGPWLVTATQTGHGLSNGNVIAVNSGSDASVDGSQTITVVDADTFTFRVTSDPTASGTFNYYGPTFIVEVTSNGHGLEVGDTVAVFGATDASTHGLQMITAKDTNTFQFIVATDPSASGTLDYSAPGYRVVVTSTSHGFSVGQTVTISSGGSALNGARTITAVPNANTFEFQVLTAPAASGTLTYAGTGTMTALVVQKEMITRN